MSKLFKKKQATKYRWVDKYRDTDIQIQEHNCCEEKLTAKMNNMSGNFS